MQNKNKVFTDYLREMNGKFSEGVPSALGTHNFVDGLINMIFPFRIQNSCTSDVLAERIGDPEEELAELLCPLKDKLESDPETLCRDFMEALPGVCDLMIMDAEAFEEFDPASESTEEIILCYPGFFSIAVYRLAHVLWEMKVPVLPRVMTEYAHSLTGVDIHPGAGIGESFFIDHGTGTVIGETSVIGNNVKIYQGVTLGATFVRKSMANQKRHPTIEDNVIIYARSTILGGETTIGHDSVIGGNVWLTESVLPFSVVYQKHHVVIRDSKKIQDQINWVI